MGLVHIHTLKRYRTELHPNSLTEGSLVLPSESLLHLSLAATCN